MDANQIKLMEEQMREEHQKDIDALNRLKRFMPVNGHESKPRSAPPKQEPLEETIGEADDDSTTTATLRGTIERIMSGDLAKKWTVQTMLAQLKSLNYPFKASKPINSVSLSLQALYKKQRIVLVRRGAGSAPNVYRGVEVIEDHDQHGRPM